MGQTFSIEWQELFPTKEPKYEEEETLYLVVPSPIIVVEITTYPHSNSIN
jgi:hypothetical protein